MTTEEKIMVNIKSDTVPTLEEMVGTYGDGFDLEFGVSYVEPGVYTVLVTRDVANRLDADGRSVGPKPNARVSNFDFPFGF